MRAIPGGKVEEGDGHSLLIYLVLLIFVNRFRIPLI